MRYAIILSSLLLGAALPANAQVTITFGVPSQSIGMNMPVYPDFRGFRTTRSTTRHRRTPICSSTTACTGPTRRTTGTRAPGTTGRGARCPRYTFPYYVLRVPVRYYRRPPQYFRGWSHDEPPRWGQYYGAQWEQERHGWDTWNRKSAPPPAPLPVYQRQYSGDRYPRYEQQPVIRSQYYQLPAERSCRAPALPGGGSAGQAALAAATAKAAAAATASSRSSSAATPAAAAATQQQSSSLKARLPAKRRHQRRARRTLRRAREEARTPSPDKDKGDDTDKGDDKADDKGQGHNG